VGKDRSIDVTKIAYQLPQPAGMISDILVAAALDLDANVRDWVPQSADVSFRPRILTVRQGYYINIPRVRVRATRRDAYPGSRLIYRHRGLGGARRWKALS
jgi:hypothetical protein